MGKEALRKSLDVRQGGKTWGALVVGATHIDVFADVVGEADVLDKRGKIRFGIGGTAYNVACNFHYLGGNVSLVTLLKKRSLFTNIILNRIENLSLNRNGIVFAQDIDEAGFISYRHNGDMIGAVTSAPIENFVINANDYENGIHQTDLVVIDLNNHLDTVRNFIDLGAHAAKPVFILGVSEIKAQKLQHLKSHERFITAIFLNHFEARRLLKGECNFSGLSEVINTLWVVTMGEKGVGFYKNGSILFECPAPNIESAVSLSGAGDVFATSFIHSRFVLGLDMEKSVAEAHKHVSEIFKHVHANLWAENIINDVDAMIYQDPLTRVYNRKFLDMEKNVIEKEAGFCTISIILFDVDNFKKVNDTYGHDSGDEVLRRFAEIIKNNIRPGDIPVRYGGEEFAVILHDAGRDTALSIADRIRKRFKETLVKMNGQTIRTTVSGGMALFKRDATLEQVMKEADIALYNAKHEGKDKICLAKELQV